MPLNKTLVVPDLAQASGLPARALNLLCDLFADTPEVCRAIVYGSRAKGNYRPGSDIDIALDAPTLTDRAYGLLCTRADDLMLPWNIDMTLISTIDNPALLAHIARVGKVLWQRELASPLLTH